MFTPINFTTYELVDYLESVDLARLAVDSKYFIEVVTNLGLDTFPCDNELLEAWANLIKVILNADHPLVYYPAGITFNSLYLNARVRLNVLSSEITKT